ncbi:MAG TPA: uroporphyrinogen-III synthase [Actinomycetota bacterium]|nr:uroporphyrinogen-III synthase [Actinomycetota bacterium]
MSLLRDRGAEPIHFPTIEIVEPLSWDEVDAAADKLQKGNYDWVVFTSVNAVERLLSRMASNPELAGSRVAAVGTATQEELATRGVGVDLVPEEFTGESLAAALGTGEGTVLLPRVENAPRAIVSALQDKGWTVDEVVAYRNALPKDPGGLPENFDAVMFASGSAARNFAVLADADSLHLGERDDDPKLVVAIGPKTAEEARAAGLRVDLVAPVHTDEGMVAILEEHFS